MNKHNYYVYIVASQSGTLYTGVTNNLERRISEHKQSLVDGFSKKYGCNRLVYYELYKDVNIAISREKQIKRWSRAKKESIISTINPEWIDLSEGWG